MVALLPDNGSVGGQSWAGEGGAFPRGAGGRQGSWGGGGLCPVTSPADRWMGPPPSPESGTCWLPPQHHSYCANSRWFPIIPRGASSKVFHHIYMERDVCSLYAYSASMPLPNNLANVLGCGILVLNSFQTAIYLSLHMYYMNIFKWCTKWRHRVLLSKCFVTC